MFLIIWYKKSPLYYTDNLGELFFTWSKLELMESIAQPVWVTNCYCEAWVCDETNQHFVLETWNMQLKHAIETCTWNMQLKHAIETRNWNMNLKHAIETWTWNMQLKPLNRIELLWKNYIREYVFLFEKLKKIIIY